jgi:fimbrial chaperone protein
MRGPRARHLRSRVARTVLLLAFLGLSVSPALASSFRVDPITVTIPRGGTSALVSIINDGNASIRFQVSGAVWHQSLAGEMQLAPSESLIFFPKIFTVGPGETKKIRVGVTAPSTNVEQAYRLTIAELPPLQQIIGPAKGAGINTLVKLSLPVFIEPNGPLTHTYDIPAPVVSGGKLRLEYVNDGNTHVMLDGVRVTGRTASGATAFDFTDKAWYVLAGGRRAWAVPLLPSQCKAASTVQIVFTVNGGPEQSQTFPNHLDCSSLAR